MKKRFIYLIVVLFLFLGIMFTINFFNKKDEEATDLKVNDAEKPVIVLNGDSIIKLLIDDEYIEEGVKATDNIDGDITNKVVIEGSVDTSKVGEYTLTYKVTDSSDNTFSIDRKIIVEIKNDTHLTHEGVVGTTKNGNTIEVKSGIYYIDGIMIVNKTYPITYKYNPNGALKEFVDNYNKMKADALEENIKLNIRTSFRSYDFQKQIYNNYLKNDTKENVDKYSARPGYSEHQTGLTADLNSLSQDFINTKEGKWLNDNCYKYGFIIRYPKGKENYTGYIYEPWHIRYVGDLAKTLYNDGDWITLEEYFGITSEYR